MMNPIFTDGGVIVIRGGFQKPYRDHSLRSGASAYHALRKDRKVFDIHLQSSGNFEHKGKRISIHRILQSGSTVFNALHGDTAGHFQRLCRKHGTRYTGSSHAAHQAITTTHTKRRVLRRKNIDTIPHWRLTKEGDKADDAVYTAVLEEIDYPVIVEPLPDSFSSKKIIAGSEEELLSILQSVFSSRSTVYVSPTMVGQIFSVLVLEQFRNQSPYIFPAYEIKHDQPVANAYEAGRGRSKTITATPQDTRAVERIAAKTFRAGNLRGIGRVDILQAHTGKKYVLDVNAYPQLNRHSLLHDSASSVGATLKDVFSSMVESAENK